MRKQNKKKVTKKDGALAVPKLPPTPFSSVRPYKEKCIDPTRVQSKTIPKRVQGVFKENSIANVDQQRR